MLVHSHATNTYVLVTRRLLVCRPYRSALWLPEISQHILLELVWRPHFQSTEAYAARSEIAADPRKDAERDKTVSRPMGLVTSA